MRSIIYNLFLGLILLNTTLFYHHYRNRGCDDMHSRVVFIDVGQGDATYIQIDKLKILIDTGLESENIVQKLKKITGCDTVKLDHLILTHADTDHIEGTLQLLKKDMVKNIIHNGFLNIDQDKESFVENQLEAFVKKNNIKNTTSFDIKNFKKIYPSFYNTNKSDNDNSLMFYVTIGSKTFLFTGDASSKVEDVYINDSANVLKLGHHGSKHSTSYDMLKKVNANEYIISAGVNNRYNHPHPEVLDRIYKLKNSNDLVIRSTFNGDIIYEL